MFGFSIAKLIVVSILIVAVWQGFKMMTRIGEVRAETLARNGAKKSARTIDVEDLAECKRCGAFVSPNAKACTRADCPFGR